MPIATRFESAVEQHGILSEEKFAASLSNEMKRCERSGHWFLLGLIAIEPLRNACGTACLNSVVAALRAVIREIDTIGWYKPDLVLAFVFPQLGQSEVQTAMNAIRSRMEAALREKIPADVLKQLPLLFYVVPGDEGNETIPATMASSVGLNGATGSARILKRSMDIIGSIVGLVLLSPLFAAIALLIKRTSDGPALLRQTRIGESGKAFTFLKFRSMYLHCDTEIHRNYVLGLISGQNVTHLAGDRHVYKMVDDPRITPFGRVLRRSSLDELPQLINVLRGEMSLIGPRPPLPYEFEHYQSWHLRRLMGVKPGMTGLWQVKGRCNTTFDEMVRLDLRYVRQWSVWLDLKILLRTPFAMWSGDGAY